MPATNEFDIKCRLCASITNKRSRLEIFNNDLSNNLCDQIMECVSIKVEKNDDLPSIICKKCNSKIQITLDFRTQCLKAEQTLKKEQQDLKAPKNPGDQVNINKYLDIQIKYETSSDDSIDSFEISDNNVLDDDTCKSKDLDESDLKIDILNTDLLNESNSKCNELNGESVSTSPEPIRRKYVKSEISKGEGNKKALNGTKRKYVKKVVKEKKPPKPPRERNRSSGRMLLEKVCDICGFVTRSLKTHMNLHLQNHVTCPVCQKYYTTKENLKRHMLIHNDYKKYGCPHCDKRFSLGSYLRRHIRVHTGERNHKCDICGKAFQTRYNLKTHIRTHTKEKPFRCYNCGVMAFSHRATFNIHVRSCLSNTGTLINEVD